MGGDYPLVIIGDEGPSYKNQSATESWEPTCVVDDPDLTVESKERDVRIK